MVVTLVEFGDVLVLLLAKFLVNCVSGAFQALSEVFNSPIGRLCQLLRPSHLGHADVVICDLVLIEAVYSILKQFVCSLAVALSEWRFALRAHAIRKRVRIVYIFVILKGKHVLAVLLSVIHTVLLVAPVKVCLCPSRVNRLKHLIAICFAFRNV